MIKLKLELPNGSIHRTRTSDAHGAWKWCVDLYRENVKKKDDKIGIEIIESGAVIDSAYGFVKLFQLVKSKPQSEEGTPAIRLKIASQHSLSFRLARDVQVEKDSTFKLATDDFQWNSSEDTPREVFHLASDDTRIGSIPFRLARDEGDDASKSIRL